MADTIQTLKKLGLIKFLLLAILLRLILMPFYFHPDIKTYHFQASFLNKGVFDIYPHLINNKEKLPFKEEFVYFPLTFFSLGFYQIIISPFLGGDFTTWLNDASQNANERIGVYRYLFLLKFPYLLIDLSIAFFLLRFFSQSDQKKKIFIFWLFNPFSIVLIYIFSNIDIIPVFLTLVSLLFTYRKKMILASLFLGIAAGFKAYPLIFLPFLLFYARDLKQALYMVIAALGIFTAIIAPFWSAEFQNSALVSGLTTRIVFPGLSIGFGETLMVSVTVIFALLFYKAINKGVEEDILYYYLALLLLLFSFIHFHIQWLLWLIPFVAIFLIVKERLTVVTLILISMAFAIPLLYEDKSMSVGLLTAISPLYNLIPIPFAVAQKFYDPYIIQSVLHGGLGGGSLVLIWQLFKGK